MMQGTGTGLAHSSAAAALVLLAPLAGGAAYAAGPRGVVPPPNAPLLAPLAAPLARHGPARMTLSLTPYDPDSPPPSESEDPPSWMPPALEATASPDPYRIALRVLPLILLHALWSCVIVFARHLSRRAWRAEPLLHMLTGSVLGLLLAFRTNQAYNRYWSACSAWATIHKASHNLARQASHLYFQTPDSDIVSNRFASFGYPSFVRHLVALPISLKQRLRGAPNPTELWAVLARSEADMVMAAPSPHLVLLASLSLIAMPLRSRDDGSGKSLALWGELERGLGELQSAACQLDLVARLPPPASYSVHTARFLCLWTMTLPIVLVELMHPFAVPVAILAVAWALYSTEELAKLLDCPFGTPGEKGLERSTPETVPVEMYCDQIVRELQQQVGIARGLSRRVQDGESVVSSDDLVAAPYPGGEATSGRAPRTVATSADDEDEDVSESETSSETSSEPEVS